MSEPEGTSSSAVIPLRANGASRADGNGSGPPGRPGPKRRVRVKKLRLMALLGGLGLLAVVSTVFGMMMAVASELPALEDFETSKRNSKIVDRYGEDLGLLTGNQNRILLTEERISPVMKQAIIAVEDKRFYTNAGVDLKGIGRALWQDVRSKKVVQGGSTITQQFVKNALAAQDDRTLFAKLREAALAYHMTRKWPKQKILRNYLNTIYFGNGAYGIESAARTYVGTQHPGCERSTRRPCASQLDLHEAALLAGVVASPSGYDPLAQPDRAKRRRDLVLQKMLEQGYIAPEQYDFAVDEALPTRADVRPPREETKYPYFTSWIKQQVVDKLGGGQTGARAAFEGNLEVRTTIDGAFQRAAQQAVDQWLGIPGGPTAALVAIDNHTAEVRAMVSGSKGDPDAYAERPFNLATQGRRQPGSAFKPFVLAEALKAGIAPTSLWSSKKKEFCVTRRRGRCVEAFQVNNYEGNYAGVTTLANATTFSDNTVYAEVGIKVGTPKVARLARRMGIRTPVSRNFAISLGGLRQGVTPLDMAHAYQSFATNGRLVWGTMSPGASVDESDRRAPVPGPVGIRSIGRRDGDDYEPIELPDGTDAENERETRRVLPEGVAKQVGGLLQSVVRVGTARRAALEDVPVSGKTGTTENFGDAWFVGWTRDYTVAVWVGYPDQLRPMKTEWRGEPVAGGTYPAAIWQAFMKQAVAIDKFREEQRNKGKKKDDDDDKDDDEPDVPVPSAPAPSAPTPAPTKTPSGQGGGGDGAGSGGKKDGESEAAPTPAQPAPEEAPADPGGAAPPAGEPPPADPAAGTDADAGAAEEPG